MAKNRENNGTFADSVMDLPENAKKNIEERNTTQLHNTDTQQAYTMTQEEIRNKRLQFVVKPSVNKALDKLVKQKKIKSKNDLVNFLLEQYIEQNK